MTVDPLPRQLASRLAAFCADPAARFGVALSGGPDSVALAVLAARALPGRIEAATVDHRLRAESGAEAAVAARAAAALGLPHAILPVAVVPDGRGVQAAARTARYAALAGWAAVAGLAAILTAHHADDQAETVLMRLARGAGLSGLAGIREEAVIAGVAVLRPLLDVPRATLHAVLADGTIELVADPSNRDPRYDRTRARQLLHESGGWPDPARIAAAAGHLAEAETALAWATAQEWDRRARPDGDAIVIDAGDLPPEIARRLALRAWEQLGEPVPRGPELARLLGALRTGGQATLGGVLARGGAIWRFGPAPPRR